jgi:PadR family transcriptional regulator PadR
VRLRATVVLAHAGTSSLAFLAEAGTFYRMVDRQDGLLAQMRRGVLQYCVLALLAEEERYGFDLVRALAEVDGMVTSEGTIYPLLSRLRRDGLVETTWRESTQGPPRRYYSATSRGRAALETFAQEWGRFRNAVDHFVERSVA